MCDVVIVVHVLCRLTDAIASACSEGFMRLIGGDICLQVYLVCIILTACDCTGQVLFVNVHLT